MLKKRQISVKDLGTGKFRLKIHLDGKVTSIYKIADATIKAPRPSEKVDVVLDPEISTVWSNLKRVKSSSTGKVPPVLGKRAGKAQI